MKKAEETKQLKSLETAELKKKLEEQKERLWTLKKELLAGKVKDIRELRMVRRMIARLLTLVKEKAKI